jgi:hypothetical protein
VPDPSSFERDRARGVVGGRPTAQQRRGDGVAAPDEHGLVTWARQRGYALDFTPADARPAEAAAPATRRASPAGRTPPPPVAKRVPRIVRQRSSMTCWAAALESWLDWFAERPRTQEQLLAAHPEGKQGLELSVLRRILASLGMTTLYLTSDELTAARVKEAVDKLGVVYLGMRQDRYTLFWWHAVVVYDVVLPGARDADPEPAYLVMDPASDAAGLARWRKSDFFATGSDRRVLFGFRPPRGGPGDVR